MYKQAPRLQYVYKGLLQADHSSFTDASFTPLSSRSDHLGFGCQDSNTCGEAGRCREVFSSAAMTRSRLLCSGWRRDFKVNEIV